MKFFFLAICAVAGKDLRLEFREREGLVVMVVFALLLLTLFSFAFGPGEGGKEAAPLQAGVLWVTFLFTSVTGFSRSMAIERESCGFSGMRLSPADPAAIYFGKMSAITFQVGVMEVAGFTALAVFYRAPVWENLGLLALIAVVATLGISAIGTLFAAMTAQVNTRNFPLPVLMFPILAPVLIGAVKATAAALAGDGWREAGDWVKLLVAYDLIFISAAVVVFEYVLEE